MDVFRTDRIRNVVLLGHGGAGKTTLTEAMAYLSGITSRLGKVTDGNTISDYDKEEIKRVFDRGMREIRDLESECQKQGEEYFKNNKATVKAKVKAIVEMR